VSQLWNLLLLQPMINGLLFLYQLLWKNFAFSIAILTVLVRLITLPLTLPQQRSAKVMQELEPKVAKIRKRYAKDRERQTKEIMKLYKEAGYNPMTGCLPLLIQFPIIIAFYQAIYRTLADNPLQMLSLAKYIYAPRLSQLIPLESRFLWLNLARPDPFYILPILVIVTTWLSQKIATPPSTDPQTASMNQMMQIYMPLMFGLLTMSWASGLAIYFVVTNLVSIIIQYFVNKYTTLGHKKLRKRR